MQPVFLGDYRLIATLGRGGMAEVFLAVRGGMEGFHKLIVIKRLRTDLLDQPQAARYRALLLDEARLAARLSHPNIVQTFEVGDHAGQPFLAMEYLDGQSLSRVLATARRAGVPLPVELALQVTTDVLAGLAYAHDLADYNGTPLRIVHRDVSPQNIFWTYDGGIKLVDFGVAKYAFNSHDTEAGVVKGKLTYMAPEQARGLTIDRRADLFVVGIVLWELISGKRLLRAPSQAASLEKLLFENLPSLSEVVPGIDPEIARICDRALERSADRRYGTAAEMRADLEQVLVQRAPRRDDLAAFIQPLFAEEREAMADHIREAMEGSGELLSLQPPDITNSLDIEAVQTSPLRLSGQIVEVTPTSQTPHTSGSMTAPGATMTAPGLAATSARSRTSMPVIATGESLTATPVKPWWQQRTSWLAAIAIAAILVISIDIVLARKPEGVAGNAPPPSAKTVATAPGSGAHTAGAAIAAPAEHPPELALCGSNTIGAELAPALVDAFLRRKGATAIARQAEPEHTKLTATLGGKDIVVDIKAAGTATGFDGLAAGQCDLGMASRAINDKEITKLIQVGYGDLRSPATEHVIGLDGIAVIVHPNNPLGVLDRGQLHDIFTGKITDWGQIGGTPGPITVLARDDKSGTFDTFKNLVLGSDKLIATAKRFAESDVLADGVAGDPQAIGFIGLAYIRAAKALRVGDPGSPAKLPTSFTVATEEYMLSRRLYFYATPKPRTPLATELVSFVLSAQGQTVVRNTNFIDLSVALREGDPCDMRCPTPYALMIAHAQRISLDFRFRVGSDEIDSRATRDLDRVVQFLRGYPDAKLMLLGFSDSAGVPAANVKLSQHRAATIARELEVRGVRPAIVEGFGAVMPLAPNTTEADRQRNRRVEAWLELAHN